MRLQHSFWRERERGFKEGGEVLFLCPFKVHIYLLGCQESFLQIKASFQLVTTLLEIDYRRFH